MICCSEIFVVLVEPQLGENIGAAARVMSNFGCGGLRIVNPRDGWPNLKALEMAAHGGAVVDQAKIYSSLKEAVSDVNYVAATTAIPRNMNKNQIAPCALLEKISHLQVERLAVVFGRERSGLTNDEVAIADVVINIATSNSNHSLNLAQAVAIVIYELCKSNFSTIPFLTEKASQNEVQNLIEHFSQALKDTRFFQVQAKHELMMRSITNLLMRAELSSQEVQTLRGVIKALASTKV